MTPCCISLIVTKVRKKPEALVDLINQQAERALTNESLACFVDTKLQNGEVLQRADDIRRDYEASTGTSMKVHRVQQVMRDLNDLRYKKIVPIPVHGNSERCLVQRQQGAIKLLEFLLKKLRVINIDESWIDSGDYRRRSW